MLSFIPHSPFLGVAPRCRRPQCRAVVRASASPDVVVIGAGIAGLSTAYELAQKGASVHIFTSPSRKPAANASAGMLASESESLSGDMLKLSRASHEMYPDFVRRLERLVDVDVHYVSRNDFLKPSLTPLSGPDVLTGDALRRVEPALGPKVLAAKRSWGDASVDSRRLMSALHKACISLGVKIEQEAVQSIRVAPDAQSVEAIQTKTKRFVGGHYLVASGAWTSALLPNIPVRPVKGQMLSLAVPENESTRLNHVLHGPDVYIVPKNNGNEIYVGATVEHVGFDSKVTAGAVLQLLSAATELVPKFAEYEIIETWSGLRPATPDLLPILGQSEHRNVTIASGYYRNGILLAPATSAIAAAFVLGEVDLLPSHIRDLAHKFSYHRLHLDESKAKVHNDLRKQAITGTGYRTPHTESTGKRIVSTNADTSIKLWKMNEDGTNESVQPSQRYLRSREELTHGSVEKTSVKGFISHVPDTLSPDAQPSTATDLGVYQGGEGFESHEQKLENISGENDAYEDVMRKRHIADEVKSRALAANRAFGRSKSSLETEGSLPLSISEEEVIAFDAAMKKGLEDMRQLEKHFDPNAPSVRATKTEQELMQFEDGDVTSPINGVEVPTLAEGAGSSAGNESSGGYY